VLRVLRVLAVLAVPPLLPVLPVLVHFFPSLPRACGLLALTLRLLLSP
jgi:hypothetical protein